MVILSIELPVPFTLQRGHFVVVAYLSFFNDIDNEDSGGGVSGKWEGRHHT